MTDGTRSAVTGVGSGFCILFCVVFAREPSAESVYAGISFCVIIVYFLQVIVPAVIGSAFGSCTLSSDRTLSRYRLSPYGSSLRISVFGLSCAYGPASGHHFRYGLVRPGAVSYGPSCDARYPNGSVVLLSQSRESRGGAAGFSADILMD